MILKLSDIDDVNKLDSNSIEYQKLINIVIKEHKLEDGITVCPNCHALIDSQYRRNKHEK